MKDLGIVNGGESQAKPLVLNNDKVYIHTDIKPLENGIYEYHEYQCELSEFLTNIVAQIERLTSLITTSLKSFTESKMMEMLDLYPHWVANRPYEVDEVVKSGLNKDGEPQLYQVIQAHISQADWLPKDTPSLYKAIGFTDDKTPIWTQPLGATDAYVKGDKVAHKDKIWTSDVDANVWEPGVYGWTEVNQ